MRRRSRIARRGGGGNAGTAFGTSRDRCAGGAVGRGVGGEPDAARRRWRANGVSVVPRTRQLRQSALPRAAVAAPAATGTDRRWVLDAAGAGGGGAGCTYGDRCRWRRHLAAAGR